MSSRLITSIACVALATIVSACDKSTTSPSTTAAPPKFTSALLPSNEVPPITNADQSGSGTVTVTLNTTKDSAGNITAATADFQVTLSGFPANSSLTGSHIHTGAAGTNGSVSVSLNLASGEITLPNGSATFSKTGIAVDAALAQAIINNPAGYYFNVHTTLNGGGAARGQLVRSN
jgi:hypothetical protein